MFSQIFSSLIVCLVCIIPFFQVGYADCDITNQDTKAAEFLAGCSDNSGGISVTANSDISGTTSDIKKKVKDIAERAIAF